MPVLPSRRAAGRDDQRDGVLPDRLALGVGQPRERQQLRYDGLLVGQVARVDRPPGRRLELGVVGAQESRRGRSCSCGDSSRRPAARRRAR